MSSDSPTADEPTPGRTVYALAADMIFAAKIRGAAQAVGTSIVLARNAAHLVEMIGDDAVSVSLIILDLDTRGLEIAATVGALKARRPATRILAYVSHVNTAAIAAARDAGADKVMARSAFSETLPQILQMAAG